MDALRYWVQEMHVDGFRFDLAAALGRGDSDFDPHGSFLEAIGQDPVLADVKLIAEPWDTGWGGYELGQFPAGWSEWNGRFRDTVRDFWRGTEGALPGLATRLSGSRDLFGHGGRRPTASVNIVTVHDGFTLADLVSYNGKHNEANGEDNRDGSDDNRSWNCGVEGPTDDPAVLELRARQRRNFLATLLLSEGAPLLLGGDEFARTQRGNNNAYCHDDELSWFDWSAVAANADLVEFTARLCRLREQHRVFRRRQFFTGTPAHDSERDDLDWYRPDGLADDRAGLGCGVRSGRDRGVERGYRRRHSPRRPVPDPAQRVVGAARFRDPRVAAGAGVAGRGRHERRRTRAGRRDRPDGAGHVDRALARAAPKPVVSRVDSAAPRVRSLVRAIQENDEAKIEAAILRLSRSHRALAPLAFARQRVRAAVRRPAPAHLELAADARDRAARRCGSGWRCTTSRGTSFTVARST